MSDIETKAEIAKKLSEECPIRAIYAKRNEPVNCVYVGHSKTCGTCTFWWQALADDVIDVMGRRVAAVKRERIKVRECRQALSSLCHKVTAAVVDAELALMTQKERLQAQSEKNDVGCEKSTEVQANDNEGEGGGQRLGGHERREGEGDRS